MSCLENKNSQTLVRRLKHVDCWLQDNSNKRGSSCASYRRTLPTRLHQRIWAHFVGKHHADTMGWPVYSAWLTITLIIGLAFWCVHGPTATMIEVEKEVIATVDSMHWILCNPDGFDIFTDQNKLVFSYVLFPSSVIWRERLYARCCCERFDFQHRNIPPFIF